MRQIWRRFVNKKFERYWFKYAHNRATFISLTYEVDRGFLAHFFLESVEMFIIEFWNFCCCEFWPEE